MKVIPWDSLQTEAGLDDIAEICRGKAGLALTIGGFDGPHIGHSVLFDAVLTAARAGNLASGVVTFTRSPSLRKRGHLYPGDVSTLKLRLDAFRSRGFDCAVLIDFSTDFGKMSGGVFFEILVKTARMKYLAVGPDFRCGHRLDTGTPEISEISRREAFRFDSIRQVELDGERVSSSAVRNAVQTADFALAERLLGHPFLLDFNAPVWTDVDGSYEASAGSFTQILPPVGRYRVVASTANGSGDKAVFEVADSVVRLTAAGNGPLPDMRGIATIDFRLS